MDSHPIWQGLGLTPAERNQLLSAVGRDQNADANHVVPRALLLEINALTAQLLEVFGELSRGQVWLRTPNPVLGGQAPLHFVLRGQPEVIRRLLIMAETGTPT